MSDENINVKQGQDIIDITGLINPFPGLRPFGIEEGHLFFGREGQSDEVLVKLAENRFVGILGASGSGKSSFMYCGLVPSLVGGFMTDAGSNWRIVVSRPGGGPIDNLAESLLIKDKEYANLSEEDQLIKKTIMGTVLRSSSLGLVEVIKQLKADRDQNILVVIDQFEELFRFRRLEAASSDMDESSAFVNLLLEAIHQFEEPIYVALTMRSDFIGECAKFPDLTQMINDSHYLIPQMTRDQKRTAVEGPVAVGGGKIAPRLTQQLLNDVGDNPDQLPILQHALMRTWANWVDTRKVGEAMDLRHYNAIGTLREALSQHANEAYDSLNKREKEICEVMFKALTDRGSENQGIRRPTKLATIAAIAGVSEDEVIRVVDKFREPGRSLLMPPSGVRLESETVVDISHESLMRIWDRLKRWLDEESKASEMYLKLSEAAERFQAGKASLWKMPDLQLALNWREENNPTLVWGQRYNPAFERTMVFLETSEKAHLTEQRNKELLQKRQVKRMRISAIVLGSAALVCLFLVVLSFIKAQDAEEATAAAEKNLADAEVQRQKALEFAADAEHEKNRANEALKAAEEQTELAKKQEKLATQAKERAVKAQKDAELAQAQAQEEKEEADKQRIKAEEAQKYAREEQAKSEALRMQSVATSMAIKGNSIKISNDQQSDRELKAVVAKQAYDYNQEFGDPNKPYNGDIYAGVYNGLISVLSNHGVDENGLYIDYKNDGDKILNQYHGHLPIVKTEGGNPEKVAVRSVAYSKDGEKMFSAGSDGRLLMWDMTSGDRSHTELYSKEHVNRVVNVSPDERYLALGTDDSRILLIDLKKPTQEPKEIKGHLGGTIYDLVFLPNESAFISTGADSRVLYHHIGTGQAKEIANLDGKVVSLAISPDGDRLAAGLLTGETKLVNLKSGQYEVTEIYNKEKSTVHALHFNNLGDKLAFGNKDGEVTIWDLQGKEKWGPVLSGFESAISDVKFSPNGRLIAASSKDGTVRMWDLENIYDLPTVIDDHKGWVWSLDFHPNSDKFVTGSEDGIIRVFHTTPDAYAAQICDLVTRNMSDNNWKQYVGDPDQIPYVYTCPGKEKAENL